MEDWDLQLSSCKDNIDRAMLARSSDCHEVLLRAFCYDDLDPLVVEEAALNPNSKMHWVKKALERFPSLDTIEFWREKQQRQSIAISEIENGLEKYSGDRDQVILKHILEKDNPVYDVSDHASQHLGKIPDPSDVVFRNPDIQWSETSKYRVAMVMAPAWGVVFPPYNLAKLVGILRQYDYSTKVYDLNIECYRATLDTLKQDYWRSEKYFLWVHKDNFHKFILPYIKPILQKAINDIVAAKPKVVGFSIYNTNLHATTYMVKEIKRLLPDVCLIAGGPEIATNNSALRMLPFNYLFVGEAENTLIELLENIPDEFEFSKFIGSTDSKLKLEDYPFADYSDYKLENYRYGKGVSIETSRGCVAQCSFCAETYFWKFRSLTPERVIAEMDHQIKAYGIKRFWFVDSLANGNLKNFERLIDLIIENNFDIFWNSYVRADGRMSKELMKKIAKSGCTSLSYGIESGSQKVLHDMRKKVDIWEIENNILDGKEAGVHNHANWIVGFPTEEPIDFLHSLQLTGNLRRGIDAISPGFGAGPAQASHMQTDWKVYDMVGENFVGDETFLNAWYTNGYKNTLLNRFIRIKFFHVWLEILSTHAESIMDNGQRMSNIESFYDFKSNETCKHYVNYDNYVKLNRLDDTEFKHNITNEYFSLSYALYQYFGECEFKITFDPEVDKSTFGNSLASDYTASFLINIKNDGSYDLKLTHKFNHYSSDENIERIYANERLKKDQSFDFVYTDSGNFNDWVSSDMQIKETVHEQYRNKKKVITILPSGE